MEERDEGIGLSSRSGSAPGRAVYFGGGFFSSFKDSQAVFAPSEEEETKLEGLEGKEEARNFHENMPAINSSELARAGVFVEGSAGVDSSKMTSLNVVAVNDTEEAQSESRKKSTGDYERYKAMFSEDENRTQEQGFEGISNRENTEVCGIARAIYSPVLWGRFSPFNDTDKLFSDGKEEKKPVVSQN